MNKFIFKLLFIAILLTHSVNASGRDSCRNRADESMYMFLYKFMAYPTRTIGEASMNDSNFSIAGFTTRTNIDSIESKLGPAGCIREGIEEFHQTIYKEVLYEGLKFYGHKWDPKASFHINTISTCRENFVASGGLKCGMSLDDVKKVVSNLKLTCEGMCDQNGFLQILPEPYGPTMYLVFLDGIVSAIIVTYGS